MQNNVVALMSMEITQVAGDWQIVYLQDLFLLALYGSNPRHFSALQTCTETESTLSQSLCTFPRVEKFERAKCFVRKSKSAARLMVYVYTPGCVERRVAESLRRGGRDYA